jgi:prophage antirepressor-like protein
MSTGNADQRRTIAFSSKFNEHITLVEFEGQPMVLAKDLGRFLQYAGDGQALVVLIAGEWSDEFVDGGDVLTLRGQRLAEFKRACKALGLDIVDKRAPSLMLLTMSGVQLVLARSEKPEGKAFRRWLVSEVIPAYERGKRFDVAPATEAPRLAGDAPAAGGFAGGGGRKPPRGGRATRALPGAGGRDPIEANASETVEERLAAADQYGQQLPRAATADELRRGQILRLVRSVADRAALLSALEGLAGPPPMVRGHRERWEAEITQAIWMVRRIAAEVLIVARDLVARIIFDRADRASIASGYLVALITVELYTLPEGVLAEVLAAVPRWRSGLERPIPLPIPMPS